MTTLDVKPGRAEIEYQKIVGGEEDARYRAALKKRLDFEAVNQGAVAGTEEIEARLCALKEDRVFWRTCEEKGVSGGCITDQIAADIRVEQWLESFAPSKDDAESFYTTHLASVERPARVRIRHILLTINDDLQDGDRDSVIRRMESIHNSDGSFEEKATRYSECPSALHGGDLGLVDSRRLFPEIASALSGMSPGEAAVIVESQMGLHLVELIERIEPVAMTHEEGMKAATALLAKRRRQQTLDRIAAQMRLMFMQEENHP